MSQPTRSTGKKLTGQFFTPEERFDLSVFSPPSQFLPLCYFFGKGLKMICVIVELNQIKYHSEMAVL